MKAKTKKKLRELQRRIEALEAAQKPEQTVHAVKGSSQV